MKLPIKTTISYLLAIAALAVCLFAQSSSSDPYSLYVQDYFRNLLQNYDASRPPKFEEILKVADQVPKATPDGLSRALPQVLTALQFRDDEVKNNAAYIVAIIAQRPDGVSLLQSSTSSIQTLLVSSDPKLQTSGVAIFAYMKPAPPPDSESALLTFVTARDRNSTAQASALSLLLRTAQDKTAVTEAVRNFLSREPDVPSKEAVLNGIANSRTKDAQLTQLVIAALEAPESAIRFTAAQALERMGDEAVLSAKPVLENIARRQGEPADVKAAARKTLQVLKQQR